MASSRHPLDVMIVQQCPDLDLPLDLAARLHTAMTVRSLPHGAAALTLIDAGARPDIILVDPRTPGVDVAAMRRMLQRRSDKATAISFIDDERALLHDVDTRDPVAWVHGLATGGPPARAERLHDRTGAGDEEAA